MKPYVIAEWVLNHRDLAVLFEVRDLWIGLYWNKASEVSSNSLRLEIYVCLLPMLVIRYRQYIGAER